MIALLVLGIIAVVLILLYNYNKREQKAREIREQEKRRISPTYYPYTRNTTNEIYTRKITNETPRSGYIKTERSVSEKKSVDNSSNNDLDLDMNILWPTYGSIDDTPSHSNTHGNHGHSDSHSHGHSDSGHSDSGHSDSGHSGCGSDSGSSCSGGGCSGGGCSS